MEENINIDLNIDILEEQGSITSSLGDIYGYFVFSTQFQERIQQQQEKREEELEECFIKVFNNPVGNDAELAFMQVMRAETAEIVKAAPVEVKEEKDSIFAIAGFTLAGVVVTTCVWLLIERILRRGKRNANRNNHV